MAQDIAKDIHSAASSLASPFTKGAGAMSKLGETAKKAMGGRSMKKVATPMKKGVHASQMKKKSMTAAEARQHRLMRARAGR